MREGHLVLLVPGLLPLQLVGGALKAGLNHVGLRDQPSLQVLHTRALNWRVGVFAIAVTSIDLL